MNLKTNRVIQFAAILILSSQSLVANAHPGHGDAGMLLHEFMHFFWLSSGVATLLVLALKYAKKNQQIK